MEATVAQDQGPETLAMMDLGLELPVAIALAQVQALEIRATTARAPATLEMAAQGLVVLPRALTVSLLRLSLARAVMDLVSLFHLVSQAIQRLLSSAHLASRMPSQLLLSLEPAVVIPPSLFYPLVQVSDLSLWLETSPLCPQTA